MNIKTLDTFSKNIKGKLKFDYSLKNHTWFNIGGNAKVFFVPETLGRLPASQYNPSPRNGAIFHDSSNPEEKFGNLLKGF